MARNAFLDDWKSGLDAQSFGGPSTNSFPDRLSCAPFTWDYFSQKFPMEFVAGFVGLSQDPFTLAIRPAIGWGVRDAG